MSNQENEKLKRSLKMSIKKYKEILREESKNGKSPIEYVIEGGKYKYSISKEEKISILKEYASNEKEKIVCSRRLIALYQVDIENSKHELSIVKKELEKLGG